MPSQRDRLRRIGTFPSLIKYLRDELDWPIGSDPFEDLTFDYTAEELGLDARNAAKVDEIKRLRPLTAQQPWGIFFVKFEPRSLPVVALRRILNSVVTKKRASSNASDRASWEMANLMFISSYGEGNGRQISFAHFAEADEVKKLPELRVLGWDSLDTPLHLDHVAEVLSERLVWPDDEDPDSWLEQWGSAFTTRHREVVATSQKLAVELAGLARSIRDRIRTVLDVETEDGPVTKLLATFREAMLDDISADDFADTYAQTIAYGLLSERITNPEHQAVSLSETGVPFTNPFLKELLGAFFAVGTSSQRANGPDQLNFDELGVYDIVELLASANMEAVVRDFGDQNPSEDPVVHFYELFLEEYDPGQRIELGVYYTPRPVVSYIVRSVDEILKRDFLLPLGVADPTTWAQLAERIDGFEIPEGIDPDRPYVSMLDPATGTGTFLVEWLTVAERNVKEDAKAQGLSGRELDSAWVEALTQTVLPNMAAFEITMASYAVAHLKVSLSLPAELRSTARLPIYLANTLRPTKTGEGTMDFDSDPIAAERRRADQIKDERPITVIVGNPPYLERARGKGGVVEQPDDGTKKTPSLDLFRQKGAGSTEFNLHNLNVYFWRWATWKALGHSGATGIVSFITTSPYLHSPAFQGMRSWIRTNATDTYVTDCTPEGHQPEVPTRLFPGVQQPLAIMTVASSPTNRTGSATVLCRPIEGRQADKFDALGSISFDAGWLPVPTGPTAPFLAAGSEVWENSPTLLELMPFKSTAVTANRPWPNAPHPDVLAERWQALRSATGVLREQLFKITRDRDLLRQVKPLPGYQRQKPLGEDSGDCLSPVKIGWRSFDIQYLIPDSRVLDMPRPALWEVISDKQVFVVELHSEPLRAGPGLVFSHLIPESSYFKGRGGRVFPLWRDAEATIPNLAPGFLDTWSETLGVAVSPTDWLEYLAGITGYPGFQEHFASDLVAPGIRVPLTADTDLYERARRFGRVALAANTRRQRGDTSDRDELVEASARLNPPTLIDPISTDPDDMPTGFKYQDSDQTLIIGTGRIAPVHQGVMDFTTSGMNVFRKWFNYRKQNPSGRTKEGLSGINATAWYDEWTDDLVAMLADLTLLVELTPAHKELLEQLVDRPLLTAAELPFSLTLREMRSS